MRRRQSGQEPLHDEAEALRPEIEEYQARHGRFADRVERFVMQVVILGLVALVAIQALTVNGPARRLLNYVEAREGVTAGELTAWSGPGGLFSAVSANGEAQTYSLTVMLMSNRGVAPEARLLVDDKVVGTFATERVTVKVQPGQVVKVDGSRYRQQLLFRVIGATGVTQPALGAEVKTAGNQQSFGAVKTTR